jgi:hypothetical protein
MPAKQFEILLATLKELRTEAEATARALRILEGQGGGLGPAGNTRTGYIRGVEAGNASGTGNQTAPSRLMDISVGAAIGSSLARQNSGVLGEPFSTTNHPIQTTKSRMDNLIRSQAGLSKWSSQRLQDEMFDERQGLKGMSLKQYETNRIMWGTSPLVQPSHLGKGGTQGSWFSFLKQQQNAIYGSGGVASGKSFPRLQAQGIGGPYYGRDQDLNRVDRRNPIYPLRSSGMGGQLPGSVRYTGGGMNIAPAAKQPWDMSPTGYGILGGLAIIGREIANTKNTVNREYYSAGGQGDAGQYGIGGGVGYNTFGGGVLNFAQGIGLGVQRAAPQLAGYALGLAGASRMGNAVNVARTAGIRGGLSSLSGVGGMFTGGGAAAMAGTAGVGALFYTAIKAMPDAIESAKQGIGWATDSIFGTSVGVTSPEMYERRRDARELGKLRMFRRVQDNMPGRQGMTGGTDVNNSVSGGYVEKAIQAKADQLAQRSGGFMDLSVGFGGANNLLRDYFSLVGLAKSRKELRAEAVDELVKKDKRIEGYRVKGWDAMMTGDFYKARNFFNEAFNASPKEGAPQAWKDPMQIYSEIQASKIASRHYAASFITRPTERTGD